MTLNVVALWIGAASLVLLGGAACNASSGGAHESLPAGDGWQQDFGLEQRSLSATGRSRYFVLEPGFQLVLANDDEQLTITVLDETKQVGAVTTRVVEEREEKRGRLVEVSRNFFAICSQTGDAFYFGEDVDVYENGVVSGHPGVWLAGAGGARAGLIMPGAPTPGARYYQEIAPGVAMDRAEIVGLTERHQMPAGTFENCLRTREGTALDPKETEEKLYAPEIGLIQDEDLKLVRYGFLERR